MIATTKASVLTALTAISLVTGSTVATASEDQDGLGRFYRQQVVWKACDDKDLDSAGAQCAGVTVPLDYSEPGGRTITVAISRLKATGTGQRRGIMLTNPGGPGGPGLGIPLRLRPAMATDVQARYDLIGMDPRGVGRSAPVQCDWSTGIMLWSTGVDRAGFDRHVKQQRELAAQCVGKYGDTLPHFSTRNTARDLDVIRGVLGESKISYFGWSYGTYLGAVYTQMFPRRADRFVLDSAVDPALYPSRLIQLMTESNEKGFDDWAAWAAARDGEYHFGATAAQVRAFVENLVRHAARTPIPIGEYRFDDRTVLTTLFGPLTDSRQNPNLAARVLAFADAVAGRPATIPPDLELLGQMLYKPGPDPIGAGQAAVLCGDGVYPRDPESYWRDIERHRPAASLMAPFTYAPFACTWWSRPAEPTTKVRNSVPALIVQATGDARTPYESGVGLHQAMTGSRLVTLKDVRVHGVFANVGNRCADDTVNAYFRDGKLPSADKTCLPE